MIKLLNKSNHRPDQTCYPVAYRWRLHSAPIFSINLNSGHYTSLVRHPTSDEYRYFNDNNIQNYRNRIGLNRLRDNKFGLVYGLISLRV